MQLQSRLQASEKVQESDQEPARNQPSIKAEASENEDTLEDVLDRMTP